MIMFPLSHPFLLHKSHVAVARGHWTQRLSSDLKPDFSLFELKKHIFSVRPEMLEGPLNPCTFYRLYPCRKYMSTASLQIHLPLRRWMEPRGGCFTVNPNSFCVRMRISNGGCPSTGVLSKRSKTPPLETSREPGKANKHVQTPSSVAALGHRQMENQIAQSGHAGSPKARGGST